MVVKELERKVEGEKCKRKGKKGIEGRGAEERIEGGRRKRERGGGVTTEGGR